MSTCLSYSIFGEYGWPTKGKLPVASICRQTSCIHQRSSTPRTSRYQGLQFDHHHSKLGTCHISASREIILLVSKRPLLALTPEPHMCTPQSRKCAYARSCTFTTWHNTSGTTLSILSNGQSELVGLELSETVFSAVS